MLKSELSEKLSQKITNLPIADIRLGVNLILSQMCHTLENKKPIAIRGLGRWHFRTQPPRQYYQLHTRQLETLPERELLRFTPSPSLINYDE